MTLTLHQHLKAGVMLAWIIVWNAMLVAGLVLDQVAGGRHAWFISAFTLAALGTATLCLSIIMLPRMQALVFNKGVAIASVRRELWLLAGVTAACGLVGPISALYYTRLA
jgi:hypothetical protein